MFKKAEPVVSRLKATFYGGPGAGKSYTALLLAEGLAAASGKRVAYIDTEAGSRHYRSSRPGDKIHPEPFDFDVLETKSLAEATEAVEAINPDEHGVLIVDQISWLYEAALDTYKARKGNDDMQPKDWPAAKKPYKDLVAVAMECPLDVILIAREKHLFRTGADGQMEYMGVGAKCDADTPYEGDLVVRMEAMRDRKDPTRTTYMAWVEKDRTSTLSGLTLANPSFKAFEPLAKLLGGGHAVPTSAAEAADRDIQAATEREEEDARREMEREAVAKEFEASLLKAASREELDSLGKAIKGSKKMRAKQKQGLRKPFLEAQARLVSA